MGDPHAELRAKLIAGRALMRMNQTELAAKLGVSLATVSRVETGKIKSADSLLEIKTGMERLGLVFTKYGVDYSRGHIEILEGEGCYLNLLGHAYRCLSQLEDKTLLIAFASDAVSPAAVNQQYVFMRQQGIKMRQLISEEDSYIMGALEEYRTVSQKYFRNIVTLIYGDYVAQVSGDETKIILHHDAALAESERCKFAYFWDQGRKPSHSTAKERFT